MGCSSNKVIEKKKENNLERSKNTQEKENLKKRFRNKEEF